MKKLLFILLAALQLPAQTPREAIQRAVGTNTITGSQSQVPVQVALLANLKAVTVANVANGQVVAILGYTAAGDGGGGQFAYNSSSTTTPNDTTVVQPTTGSGRWLRISYIGLTATVGGTNGQTVYNNSGVSGGYTMSGDATIVTSTGAITIADNAVTNAKAAQVPANRIKGNNTGVSANAIDLTVAQAKTLLAIANTDVSGLGTMSTQAASAVAITGGTMASVAISGGSITGLSVPTASSDAATKAYADSISAGISPRSAVRLGTTANITLSGTQTIDGLTANVADRVLVKNQTSAPANGIYTVAAGAWSRATDSDTAGELLVGYYYLVTEGSTQASTGWFIQTAPAVIGVNNVTFGQFSANQSYTAGTNLSLAANVFSLPATITGQNLTSSTFNGTVGATTPSTGVFTTVTVPRLGVNVAAPSGEIYGHFQKGSAGGAPAWTSTDVVLLENTAGSNTNLEILSSTGSGIAFSNPSVRARGSVFYNHGTDVLTLAAAGATSASFTSTGMNTTAIGATTPSTGAFTTLTGSSTATGSATSRTLANRFADIINVKDYGATGDGSTNDVAAINAAIAVMANYKTLYFPPGRYRITSACNQFAGLSHIAVVGEDATILNDTGASGANTFVFTHTCSDVVVRNLRFVGTATVRGSGIHIRGYCSDLQITGCYFTKSSDFGVHISNDTGDTTASNNVLVANNIFNDTLGDGVHVSSATNVVVANNVFYNSGDDSIAAVRDSLTASAAPTRVVIVGNTINRAGYGTAAVSGAGIRLAEVIDVLVEGNSIDYTYQAPIFVERYLSTSAFNYRVQIIGNKIINGNQLAGALASITLQFCQGVTVSDNNIDDAANGGGISFLDCNDAVIQNNRLRNIPQRGITSDDSTTTNVAASAARVWILNNSLLYTLANEAIYVVAPTGKTITDFVIAGNNAGSVPAGNYIYYNRVSNGKICNNLQLAANTIGAGGTVASVTLVNNN